MDNVWQISMGHFMSNNPEIQLFVRCAFMGVPISLCECPECRESSVNRQHAICNDVAKTDGAAVIVGYPWQNAGL
jgi:hypothetical protein